VAERRSFDERVALYVAFSERVARLADADWNRLNAECAALDSTSFGALLERTRLSAKPYEMHLPGARESLKLAAIKGASRAVMNTIFFTYQIAREFDEDTVAEWPARVKSTGNPRTDAHADAIIAIERAIAPREGKTPGVASAIRAAGQAVLRRDWMAPEDFEATYRYVEPIIPYASLTSQS
jgi:hypothetical protein